MGEGGGGDGLRKVYAIRQGSNTQLDSEQSLFFFRFSESNARARERRSGETRVAICVSRVLLDGLQKKRETARSLTLNATTLQNNLIKSVKCTFKQDKHATATKRAPGKRNSNLEITTIAGFFCCPQQIRTSKSFVKR